MHFYKNVVVLGNNFTKSLIVVPLSAIKNNTECSVTANILVLQKFIDKDAASL